VLKDSDSGAPVLTAITVEESHKVVDRKCDIGARSDSQIHQASDKRSVWGLSEVFGVKRARWIGGAVEA
jgi:hypothetical protein